MGLVISRVGSQEGSSTDLKIDPYCHDDRFLSDGCDSACHDAHWHEMRTCLSDLMIPSKMVRLIRGSCSLWRKL